jgi:glutamate/tyrosine decarboxylase-like PLP-dependent enzyme
MHRFDADTAALTDSIFEYLRWRLSEPEMALDRSASPEELNRLAPSLICEAGNPAEVVLAQFTDVLAYRVLSADSPRYLAFIPAAPTKASLLFDAVVSASSLNGISWLEAAGAVHAENQVLRFLADLAGLPAGAGGCFVSGGSAANLSALVVARDVIRARRGLGRQRPVRFLTSPQAHSSVASTARILDVEVEVVPGEDDRLTGDAVHAFLASDPDPETIVAVVATAGTTNAGIVDDLEGVGRAAAEAGAWFHVDGAYGGAALLAPSVRDRFAGIEGADSFVVDPHKWLFAPFDCAALLYRDPNLARSVHAQEASYLDAIREPGAWNPTDYAYHLTRRARGLALWFSLCIHGIGAYRDAVEAALHLARWTAARIDELDHLELVRAPELSIVLFRRPGWTRPDYEAWSARLLEDQVGLVLPTTWRGEPVLRLAFLHPGTTTEMVEEILASLA